MRYASIRKMDISNGPSIGVSLFVQGCHFHCSNCFNSNTWDFNSGKEWNDETENMFMELAKKDHIKRITILGGEPLADENINDVVKLLQRVRRELPDKYIVVYTGYTFEELIIDNEIITNCESEYLENPSMLRKRIIADRLTDLLVDGPFINSLRDLNLLWRGSSNQRLIDISKTLDNIIVTNFYDKFDRLAKCNNETQELYNEAKKIIKDYISLYVEKEEGIV